jgi:hypothetical protein
MLPSLLVMKSRKLHTQATWRVPGGSIALWLVLGEGQRRQESDDAALYASGRGIFTLEQICQVIKQTRATPA